MMRRELADNFRRGRYLFPLLSILLVNTVAPIHSVCGEKDGGLYTDQVYQLTIRIPQGWKRSTTIYKDRLYFEGPDGQFQMDASESDTPEQVCKGATTHHLKPYGQYPEIRPMKIDGQKACLVWPSVEQGPHADALVAVEYPHPIKIVTPIEQPARVKQIEGVYGELMIIGDKAHIVSIAKTLRFQVSK
jgi:hypothetical protein